jgi:hypothetical protein
VRTHASPLPHLFDLDAQLDALFLSPQMTFPLVITFFSKPHIQEATMDSPLDHVCVGFFAQAMNLIKFKTTPNPHYCIHFESPSQVPLFLGLLVDLLSKAVCPPLRCQWFLVDVILKVTEIVSSTFDFCLSPSCNTTSAKRSRSLTQVVTSATSLLSLALGFEAAVENLLSRLLRYRLQEGPNANWESLDIVLSQAFKRPLVCPPVKAVVALALDVLRKGIWGDVDKRLCVCQLSLADRFLLMFPSKNPAVAYLHICLPHLDADTLQAANDVLSTIGEADGLFSDRPDRQLAFANPVDAMDVDKPLQETSDWRQNIRTDMEEILVPDCVSWMDDDETLSDHEYARGALNNLLDRFTR